MTGTAAVPAGSFPAGIARKGPERPLGLPGYLGRQGELSLRFLKLGRLQSARAFAPVVAVRNLFSLVARGAGPALGCGTGHGIGFIPWVPAGRRAAGGGRRSLAAPSI